LFVARTQSAANSITVQQPQRVAALGEGGVYDVSPDGSRAVILGEGDSRVQLVVTSNWIAQLRARIDASK
jgi:hypothetical protein